MADHKDAKSLNAAKAAAQSTMFEGMDLGTRPLRTVDKGSTNATAPRDGCTPDDANTAPPIAAEPHSTPGHQTLDHPERSGMVVLPSEPRVEGTDGITNPNAEVREPIADLDGEPPGDGPTSAETGLVVPGQSVVTGSWPEGALDPSGHDERRADSDSYVVTAKDYDVTARDRRTQLPPIASTRRRTIQITTNGRPSHSYTAATPTPSTSTARRIAESIRLNEGQFHNPHHSQRGETAYGINNPSSKAIQTEANRLHRVARIGFANVMSRKNDSAVKEWPRERL